MFNFGIKNILAQTFNLASRFLANDKNLLGKNVTSVDKCYSTFAPYSRGIFAHEKGPRGNQYKAKVMKRIRTHGLSTRLESRGGKQVLWRKIIKGPSGWTNFVVAP